MLLVYRCSSAPAGTTSLSDKHRLHHSAQGQRENTKTCSSVLDNIICDRSHGVGAYLQELCCSWTSLWVLFQSFLQEIIKLV